MKKTILLVAGILVLGLLVTSIVTAANFNSSRSNWSSNAVGTNDEELVNVLFGYGVDEDEINEIMNQFDYGISDLELREALLGFGIKEDGVNRIIQDIQGFDQGDIKYYNMFLKIEGINGESEEKDHKNWIDLLSFNYSVTRSETAAGGPGGLAPPIGEIVLTKYIDKATPGFHKALCSGTTCNGPTIPEMELEICETADEKKCYFKYTLKDVMITSINAGGRTPGGGLRPIEEITLAVEEIKVEVI